GRVLPGAHELPDGRARLVSLDQVVEKSRLPRLVDDDLVLRAPPQLQRDTGAGDRACIVERTAGRIRSWIARRRAPDLLTRHPLEVGAEREERKVAVAHGEVGVRVEGGGAGQQM